MIHSSRLRTLADRPSPQRGRFVLYWMQRAQRVGCNHALEFAVERANALGLPVLVGFGLTDDYPEANERHYAFMLEGLAGVATDLTRRGIGFAVRHGRPDAAAIRLAAEGAALLVCDRGYLRHEKAWRATVAESAGCPVVEVETDVVVPVEQASTKHEIGARTLRPRIGRRLDEFLELLAKRAVKHRWRDDVGGGVSGDIDVRDVDGALARLKLDRGVGRVRRFRGGEREAQRLLRLFLKQRLAEYEKKRSEPAAENTSTMSPYLHFGQISPLDIALQVRAATAADGTAGAYLEELIVRRELAMNFVAFNPDYDRWESVPAWARKTLDAHRGDARPHLYGEEQLVRAETHDPYWNAATKEMTLTGYMHNYMRMYWGKKILEWSPDPAEAFRRTLALNNRFFLDGRDANSFANVGWVFGLHDRPWTERPIFGNVRYMNAKGLERKFDIRAYVDQVERIERGLEKKP